MNELQLIERAANRRVLFCGELIVDVYHHVNPLGRPTKDAIVSVELQRTEEFRGGVVAAAKHAMEFAHVKVWEAGQVIRKERYVEASHVRKLFECYRPSGSSSKPLPEFKDYDSTIITDYGHGMADERFIDAIYSARYLAINVQTNSGNYGFNLATKYPMADYLCVDEPEARLATQNRSGPIENSLRALGKVAGKVIITLGKAGAIGWSEEDGVECCSSFTDKVVDTMGAGDAFFAVTAVLAPEATISQLLRIGNAAGAIKAGIVGHRGSVTKNELLCLLQFVPKQANASNEKSSVRRHFVGGK